MSAQKRRRVKEANRAYCANRKSSKNGVRCQLETDNETQSASIFTSPAAKRKAISRVKRVLPKSRDAAVEVLAALIATATPEKKRQLEERCMISPRKKILFSESLKNFSCALAAAKRKDRPTLLKTVLGRRLSRKKIKIMSIHLGVRWKYLWKVSQLKEESCPRQTARALPRSIGKKIKDFFIRPEISDNVPLSKKIKKDGKSVHIMKFSMAEAHAKFSSEHGPVVGKSKFAALRPPNVRPMGNRVLQQCLCTLCTNVELKLKALNKYTRDEDKIKDKYEAVNITMCPKKEEEPYHHRDCINRKCARCGTSNLQKKLNYVVDHQESVHWLEWHEKRLESGTFLKDCQGKLADLVLQLVRDLELFSLHLFRATWEYRQFQTISQSIPMQTVIAVMDFGQNYRCEFQDEPQFLNWAYNQVSVHAVVTYYNCPDCSDPVQEDLIFLSPVLKHDPAFVSMCERNALSHLQQERKLDVNHLIEFTDTCASQYRSKNAFKAIAQFADTEIKVTRCYFGSRHGKGPSDGAVAVVKSAAKRAVKARKTIIQDAKDMYCYLQENMQVGKDAEGTSCSHYLRTFFYADDSDIGSKSQQGIAPKTVPGTLSIYSVTTSSDDGDAVYVRNLSCLCNGCLSSSGSCENTKYVDPWETVSLVTGKRLATEEMNRDPPTTVTRRSGVYRKVRRPLTNNPRCAESAQPEENKENIMPSSKTEGQKTRRTHSRTGQNSELSDKSPVCKRSLSYENGSPCPKNKRQATGKNTVNQLTCDPAVKVKHCNSRRSVDTKRSKSLKRVNWGEIQSHLARCKSFSEMKEYISTHAGPPLPEVHRTHSVESTQASIDPSALDLLDDETPDLFPVHVYGDGNCFPRSLSMLVYGNQFHMQEMRARLVHEGVSHLKWYLDNEYLNNGTTHHGKGKPTEILAQFSETFTPGDVLTPAVIQRILEDELLNVAKMGTYCGLWQFAMAANILRTQLCPTIQRALVPMQLFAMI